jgi:hypothetical protein
MYQTVKSPRTIGGAPLFGLLSSRIRHIFAAR